ncbi:hypothetical protein G5I_03065 [Acromyrmex echinatior]|uniref:Uncharacterized protein n=1 Tax=Acromyrmex echinatior TaxID=103372 RepID=F4WBZ4_ACREC|nr:hypothetical protein G5I_03065 [Acromyrmex echinatior]
MREGGGATRHKHSVAWHGISIDIYTVSMGISTRSDSGRAPPNTADSDPARSTQTRESIVAFKLPSYSGGLSLPEFRATSGRIRTGNAHRAMAPISYERATSRSLRNIRRRDIRESRAIRFALFAELLAPAYIARLRQSIDLSDRGNSRTEPKFHPPRRKHRGVCSQRRKRLSICLDLKRYVLFLGDLNSGQCKRYMLLCNSHSNAGNVRGRFGKDLHEDGVGVETRPVN